MNHQSTSMMSESNPSQNPTLPTDAPPMKLCELSYEERSQLALSPLVKVHTGSKLAGSVPLKMLAAVSQWTREHIDEYKPEEEPRIYLHEGLTIGEVDHVLRWMIANLSSETYSPLRGELDKTKENMMICRAARLLKVDQSYYQHIVGHEVRALSPHQPPSIKLLEIIDELVIGDQDPFFALAVKRSSDARYFRKWQDPQVFEEFLATHPKFAGAVRNYEAPMIEAGEINRRKREKGFAKLKRRRENTEMYLREVQRIHRRLLYGDDTEDTEE